MSPIGSPFRAMSVSTATLPNSAVHQWKLGEGSGTTATDNIGSDTGTLSGSGFWTTDPDLVGGYGLQADGSNNLVDTGQNDDLGESAAVAITVEWSSFPSTDEHIFSGGYDTGTNTTSWELRIGVDGDLYMGTYDGLAKYSVTYPQSNLPTGTKIRIVGQYRSGSWELAIDGSLVASNGTSTGFITNSSKRYIMAHYDGSEILHLSNAVIDNPVVYHQPLSPSELSDDYQIQPWAP